MNRFIYWLLLFIILTSVHLYSKSTITADSTYVKYGNQKFLFDGHVQLESPNLSLSAHTMEYSKNNLQADGDLKLKLKQDNIDITAQELIRKDGITTLTTPNSVVLLHDVKNERDLEAEKILIEDKKNSSKQIHFQGNPKLTQKSIKAKSDEEILYNQTDKTTYFLGIAQIEDTEKKTQIQSKDIAFIDATQKLIFKNTVNISDNQNHFLSGSTGDYNIENKYLNLDNKVQYLGDIAKIYSDRLRTDKAKDKKTNQDQLVYIFEKNIKLSYQNFIGTSQKVVVDPDKNFTELVDKVYLKGQDNGLEVRCDIMDIIEKERKSYLYNNVDLIDGDRHFTSDVATYDDRTKLFTLRGNAKYTKGTSIYTAQIIYLNNNDLSIKFVGQVEGSSPLEGLTGIVVDNNK